VAEPGAVLANFTNPAGLITQALALHAPRIGAVGVCNVPITAKMMLLDRLERITGRRADPAHAQLDTLGLNHLSWHRGLTVDGCDVWPLVLGDLAAELEASEDPEWDPSELARTGLLPNHYLQYYYRTRRKLAEQDNWPPSRAEQVVAVEAALMERYDDPALSVPPAELMQRGGAWYSTAATQLLAAHHLDAGEIHVANVRNAGAVRAWPEEWVLELPCRVDRQGITPLPAPPLPEEQTALLRRVKAYELLVVEAAVRSDRNAAREALTAHPLGPAEVDADDVLSDLLATNRPFLPGFWE
jgi:6-phospho-beta-glucosidase